MARLALVTGGVSGIGAAISKLLKASGYRVVANYFGNEADAQAFHAETEIPVRAFDVADFDATQAGIAAIVAEFGPVEVLVNNAGITRDSSLHKMTLEQWRSVIEVDLGGCFNTCRAVIESMREQRFGRIVNISSINGLSGQFGQTNYSAAKAGVIGFTKALALEGASRGITVNAIAPGYTGTTMVKAVCRRRSSTRSSPTCRRPRSRPRKRSPRGVLFLVGEEAGFITGETLSINGGRYMH